MKALLAIAAFTASTLLSGCMATRANMIPDIDPATLKSQASVKTKIYSNWTFKPVTMPNTSENIRAAAAAMGKKNFEKVLEASSCCVLVDSRNMADVEIDGVIYGEGNPAAMIPAFITGLSLYTIPSWVTGKPHLSASVKQGETVREYDFRDEMTMVQWLPLVLTMPFREHPLTMAKDVDENVLRNLVSAMKRDGSLQ